MELISIDDGHYGAAISRPNLYEPTTRRTANGARFISLRKYSLAICLLEALAIALIVGYMWFKAPDTQAHLGPKQPGLVEGCNQKVHDKPFSVSCQSSTSGLCPTLRQLDLLDSKLESKTMAPRGLATVSVTSKAGDRMSSKSTILPRIDCSPGSLQQAQCNFMTLLTLNMTKQHQKIIGWGGALTDSSINNILSLSTNGTNQLLEDYFGQDGLRMNMVRITIGGSDFSSRFYTNMDDPMLGSMQLMPEDTLYKIPILQYLQAKNWDIKVFASMWSPPIWMKTNNHFNKGYLKGSLTKGPNFNDTYFKKLVALKKDFLIAYLDRGIRIWGLTVMNEPIFAVQPFLNFNTMIFPKEEYAEYIAKYLGPEIRNNPRLKQVKLMVHDDNRRFLMQYTDEVLAHQGARRYIDGITTHGYIDLDYHLMKDIQQKHTSSNQRDSLFVLPSELCSGHLPWMDKATLGNWNRGVHYAIDIIKGLQNAAAGWVDWNMALDVTGGPGWLGGKLDSPIIVDKTNDEYHRSPMFYVLGQFSRFIPPGSRRIDAFLENDLFDYHFETVAFIDPDNNTIIVILNTNPYPINLYFRVADQRKKQTDYLHLIECQSDSVTTVKFKELSIDN